MDKTQPDKEQADQLLSECFVLRDLYQKDSSYKRKFVEKQNECMQVFDYMVRNKLKKYLSYVNYEDLYQDGKFALFSAIQTYQLGRGSFFWWANHYIGTIVSRKANKHSTVKISMKKSKDIHPVRLSQLPIIIDSFDIVEKIYDSEIRDYIQKALKKLPKIQRRIIELKYDINPSVNRPSSINDACKELDISLMKHQKLLQQAQNNLKKYLNEIVG